MIYAYPEDLPTPCGDTTLPRYNLFRNDGVGLSLVACVDERCVDPDGPQHIADSTLWASILQDPWAQTQPLESGYAASPPAVGDYLTVPDTLPTPAAGTGYYCVVAVNYAGERRCGRKASGGQLSGRDPAVLPGCE